MEPLEDPVAEIIREGVCLLGGVVAILMQAAHPKVALAISNHSTFQSNVWHRIDSSITYVYIVLLGEESEREELAKSVKFTHMRVKSEVNKKTGYAASNPDLLLWVNATVYCGMIYAHERAFGEMREEVADQVFQQFGRLGALLHEDPNHFPWPKGRQELHDYWQKTYKELVLHPEKSKEGMERSKKLQETFFDIQKHVEWPLKILFIVTMPFLRAFAIMSLPVEIRKYYDLKPTRTTQALDSLVGFLMCKVYPHLPKGLRRLPSKYILRRAELRRKPGRMQTMLSMPPAHALRGLGSTKVDRYSRP